MSELSQDELTVLMIAAEGEPMAPIGRWKEPTEALVRKGLLKPYKHVGDPTGYFNNYITPAGKTALKADEDGSTTQLAMTISKIDNAHATARRNAEAIAVQLVDLAELSYKITGDDKVKALRNWAKVILTRALELMQ